MHRLSDYLTCAKYKYLEIFCGDFYAIFLGNLALDFFISFLLLLLNNADKNEGH